MRLIKTHVVEGDPAPQLQIEVLDEPGSGGANHLYQITGMDTTSNPSDPFTARYGKGSDHSTILFQNGPVPRVGSNGTTHEAHLAILIDRLTAFQAGPFASEYNDSALRHLWQALQMLQMRTKERILRNVEGTEAR